MFQSLIYLSKRLFNFWVNTYFMSQLFFCFILSPLVFLALVSLLRCYALWACVTKFWLKSWVCFFSAVTSAFQLFTRKLCLQCSGLRMRNFTWNRFPIENLLIESLLTPIVQSTYLNRDMCEFESSQKDESRWHSTDSSKAYRNTSAFKLIWLSNMEHPCTAIFDTFFHISLKLKSWPMEALSDGSIMIWSKDATYFQNCCKKSNCMCCRTDFWKTLCLLRLVECFFTRNANRTAWAQRFSPKAKTEKPIIISM